MSIQATEPVAAGMYLPPSQAAGGGADKEMFLQLLVAQLRYQDPMNPADSSEFLSQSAQFTSLEKMQDLADQTAALLASQVSFGASGLVGKQVTYLDADGASISGMVSSVTYDATGPTLVVDGARVTLGHVTSVDVPGSTPPAPVDPPASDGSTSPTRAFAPPR